MCCKKLFLIFLLKVFYNLKISFYIIIINIFFDINIIYYWFKVHKQYTSGLSLSKDLNNKYGYLYFYIK